MKYLYRATVAIVASFGLGASAIAAPCAPIEPRDLDGQIQVAFPGGQSFAIAYFRENGCDWGGSDQLNGLDGLVLDVDGLGGTKGSMVVDLGTSLFTVPVRGEFLDASCAPIAGTELLQPSDGETYGLEFPVDGRWLVITPETGTPSNDVSVAVHSDGKVCKTKKKKKRK